ncbi:MAG: rRNA pseudouridine synthase [Acidithiobacillus sp.]|nr:rRNA pseudouridine synthase [Acidithiobacillus sp.]
MKTRTLSVSPPVARYGLARILSKRGYCSRTQAEILVRAGRVRVGSRVITDPEEGFPLEVEEIWIDGQLLARPARRVLLLHKPRGLLVTRQDERGRPTIFTLLPQDGWFAPVGRLDQASSGLLLCSNDPAWAQQILDPAQHLEKTYHVQVRPPLSSVDRHSLAAGPTVEGVSYLPMKIRELRSGGRTQWLEFRLREGKNRQIRRLLASRDRQVLRLIRVAIGPVVLGDLPVGAWRWLEDTEIQALEGALAQRS